MMQRLKRVHPIVWVTVVIMAISHGLLNLRGATKFRQLNQEPRFRQAYQEHGWPFIWLKEICQFTCKGVDPDVYVWPGRQDAQQTEFNCVAFAADVAIAVAATVAAACVGEWLIVRLHMTRRFAIRPVLLILAIFVIAIFFLRAYNPGLYPGLRYSFFNIILTVPATFSFACLAFFSIRGFYLLVRKVIARRR